MGDPGGRIEWTYTPRTSRLLYVLAYVPIVVWGGLVLLVVGFISGLAIDALVTGDVGQLVVVVGVVLAGLFLTVRGPGAIWLLPDERERFVRELDVPLGRRRLLVVSVIGAVALLAAATVEVRLAAGIFLGGMGTSVVVAALRSEGAIDPESLTLTYDTREVPLAALKSVRAVTLGSIVVCWLSFARGSAVRAPRLVAFPAGAYRRARPVLERGIDAPSADGRTAPLTERIVYFVVGVGSLAVGPALWLAVPAGSEATSVVVLIGAIAGVFGLLFVWLGIVS